MLVDLEPELVKELELIHDSVTSLKIYFNPMRFLMERIKEPLDLLKYGGIVKLLTQEEKNQISNYTFELGCV